MPILDLECPACNVVFPDRYVPLTKLAEPDRSQGYRRDTVIIYPWCSICSPNGGYPALRLRACPPRVRMDFDMTHAETIEVAQPDGSVKRVTLDSLSKIRALERESEQRARDGEGQKMVWRDYSQNKTNQDVHTLAAEADHPAVLSKAAAARFGPSVRRSLEAPDVGYGPGVDDATASALGGDL